MSNFEKYYPTAVLAPYIRLLAVSENEQETCYKVLPGTSLVLGFQYKGKLAYIDDRKENRLSAAGITGIQDRFRIFKNSEYIGSVLVFFTETGAAAFFRFPVHELYAESLSLDHFFDNIPVSCLQERLAEASSNIQRIHIIEQFLISHLQDGYKEDLLVKAALQYIHDSKGTIRIKQLADLLHTSQSPLEKRFRKTVGASPKKFATIVRFRSAIKAYAPPASLTAVAYEAGYFDQAHFIKDFRQFTGETPEQFFLKK